MREGLLKLRHRSGVENPADLFTKCLSAKAFYKHRYALGIVVPDGLTAELAELRELCVLQQVLTQGSSIAIVELCCSEHSNWRKVCEASKVPYIGVVAKVQSSGTLSRVAVCIRQWKNSSCPPWVHIHASTPCGSGSPLRNFNPIRTQSLKRTRNGMRSSTRLVVTSNMQTHVRLSFQNEIPFGPDLRQ